MSAASRGWVTPIHGFDFSDGRRSSVSAQQVAEVEQAVDDVDVGALQVELALEQRRAAPSASSG